MPLASVLKDRCQHHAYQLMSNFACQATLASSFTPRWSKPIATVFSMNSVEALAAILFALVSILYS
jgi:hypothetical protein